MTDSCHHFFLAGAARGLALRGFDVLVVPACWLGLRWSGADRQLMRRSDAAFQFRTAASTSS
jgi:hypothetical protein